MARPVRIPIRLMLSRFLCVLAFIHACLAAVPCTLQATGGDDAPQLLSAMQSCSVVTVAKGVTLSIGTRLNMTGLSNKHLSLQGTIKFTPDIPYWTGNAFFIPFQTQVTFWLLGGKNLRVDGGGTLDGSGQIWYDTFASNSSLLRPIVLTLFQATDVVVENINMINGPEWFNLVNEGKNIVYSNLHIDARSTSSHKISNTDGWNIYRSDNVTIQNSVINNGDDCVAFKPNATNVLVSNLQCNGSHGISVGSLGQFPDMFDIVENVLARNVTMTNAQNGARIKAWAGQGVGAGRVKNITFQHFVESKVDNPVVIDQASPSASACAQFPSNVFISDIFFNDISGTSSGSLVAALSCSPDGRCSDINVNDFTVKAPSGTSRLTCQNVNVTGNAASLFPPCAITG
ncbi:hypothetical protein CCMSSC00406_0008913 [Pleurotus cornucopiae]|uniref:Uncharacterized protein n=1 Tax=Pleurotus cornucopiae TaxID=5321 RepID=A0ACB7ISR6_PLECO|nr:hypothetical protein CCMSSC00406_0008913 [Pleurotus cornucopiae]